MGVVSVEGGSFPDGFKGSRTVRIKSKRVVDITTAM
jgi:hypothetical protein